MRSINLHQLATFQVVAKHCSYVRAAEELHFSQPAVSAQIRQLEEAMGVKLFDKIGRKTHLTQAGEELYLYSQKIFSLIDETLETMASLRSPYYGRLSVGADTTVGTYVIPGILGKFHQIYPEVDITLEVVNRVYLVDALANNRIDMVIMGKVPSDLPVFSAPFAANELVVVAPPTHRLAGCKRVPFAELAREHFLLREVGSGTRVALDIELETNRLVILDVEGFPIMRQWYLVHLKEKNLSSTARAFKSFILQHADIFMQGHSLQAPARKQGNGLVRIVQERE